MVRGQRNLKEGFHAMRRVSYLASVVLAGGLVHQIALVPTPHPEEGTVADGIYTNKYFHLSYPVPPGWKQGSGGGRPSYSANYVLTTLVPIDRPTGSVMIAAQDTFFVPKALRDIMPAARELSRAMAALPATIIDRQPEQTTISGLPFSRVDFSGVGLFRSAWSTQIRCHLVNFNLMANTLEQLDFLRLSLNKIVYAGDQATEDPDPICIDDYAKAENIVAKIDPEPAAPNFTPIPLRIVVGSDGSVKDVHVIRASTAQRNNIEKALAQWKFKPHQTDGRADEIETNLLIEFRSGGTVRYSNG
jgi:hypothetical protein